MANRYYTFAEHEFYHTYNRGNSKQAIFKCESDYDRFTKLLYIANNSERFVMRELEDGIFDVDRKNTLVHIGAYCLMSNHYHLLLAPAIEGGVSKFMLKLATGYSTFFNKKYNRTGGLFEGPFKAKHIDSDRYLKYIFSYIHLNPYRDSHERMHTHFSQPKLLEYRYSSLPDYLGEDRVVAKILSKDAFPKYFNEVKELKGELMGWLDYQEI